MDGSGKAQKEEQREIGAIEIDVAKDIDGGIASLDWRLIADLRGKYRGRAQ